MRHLFPSRSLAAAVAFAGLLAAPWALAQAPAAGALKTIKERGEITLGYRDSSIPFSYLDNSARPIGYSIDLCHRVVDAVKKQLAMPGLKVNLQAVKIGRAHV